MNEYDELTKLIAKNINEEIINRCIKSTKQQINEIPDNIYLPDSYNKLSHGFCLLDGGVSVFPTYFKPFVILPFV